ncbi:MAG: OmpA family protein [Prevotellaceae bacterium]|jgi:flagellar motor protein MotB|nr:OmpA family protein [Prevotellaceae bacterium]
MIKNKNSKIGISIIVILLSLVQSGFSRNKKNDLNCKSCKFHISNFYLPSTVNHLKYTPVFSANILHTIDIDNDGVPDRLDNCPVSFGTVEMKGCPPFDYTKSISYGNPNVYLKRNDFDLMVEIFSNLKFEGAEQLLNEKSQQYLNELVKFLKREKKLYLYISAYVNLSNNRMHNLYLSESRALSVRNYLVKSGVESNRIETLFFGDMMPVIELPDTRFEVEICTKKKP